MPRKKEAPKARTRKPVTITLDSGDLARVNAHRARLKVDAYAAAVVSLMREGMDAVEARS
jgi:hypothetical protein